jgi:hypothetical protein
MEIRPVGVDFPPPMQTYRYDEATNNHFFAVLLKPLLNGYYSDKCDVTIILTKFYSHQLMHFHIQLCISLFKLY